MAKGKPSQFGGAFFTHTPPTPYREREFCTPNFFSAPNLRERGTARNERHKGTIGAVELIARVGGGLKLRLSFFSPFDRRLPTRETIRTYESSAHVARCGPGPPSARVSARSDSLPARGRDKKIPINEMLDSHSQPAGARQRVPGISVPLIRSDLEVVSDFRITPSSNAPPHLSARQPNA